VRITSASTTACPKIARLPSWLVPDKTYYFGVDTLIPVAMGRDWIFKRSEHPVYLYGLPALVLGQASVMWIYLTPIRGLVRIVLYGCRRGSQCPPG